MQTWNKTISIWTVVEARSLDEVTRGEFIGCQDLRLKGGTWYNIKITEGQVLEDPGEEWDEKKVKRMLSKQFLVEHNSTY